MRAYHQEHLEAAKERNRAWMLANVAAVRAKRRLDRLQNGDKMRESVRAWVQANPERAQAHGAKRRALKRGATVAEQVIRLVVLERADGVCGICGEDVNPFAFHVDHIVPLSRGGEHSYANTQPAHPLCNLRKHARLPDLEAA